MGVTGCFVDKRVDCKHKHPAEITAAQVCQSLCVDIVEDWGQGGALWKSHCQLLRGGDPVFKLRGDLSFLECCCEPSVKLRPYC